MAMNFAIRKDGKFLGEVIIYNFDFKGGAEIGVRILPEAEDVYKRQDRMDILTSFMICLTQRSKRRGKAEGLEN